MRPARRFCSRRPGTLLILFLPLLLSGQRLAYRPARADTAPSPPPKAKVVPATLLSKDKLSGENPHLPDVVKARNLGKVVTGTYKVCLTTGGTVSSVEVITAIPEADDAIMQTLRSWVYKPQPINLCFIQALEFHIEASGPAPAPAAAAGSTPDRPWGGSSGVPPAVLQGELPVVQGKLTVSVYSHQIVNDLGAKVPCLTFVTSGLSAHKHQELSLTLLATGDFVEHSKDAIALFASIYDAAAQGRLVQSGDRTTLRQRLIGSFNGVAYVPAEPIPGIPLGNGHLAMLLMQPVERSVVEALGINRLTTHLGQRYHYFPNPFWNDPARTPVLGQQELTQSLLNKLPTMILHGAYITQERDTLKLRLLPKARQALLAQLKQHRDLLPALITDYEPAAGARLVWSAGQEVPTGISASGGTPTKIGGGFLFIFPDADADEGRLLEDGFLMNLKPASWTRFRDALTRGQPITLPSSAAGGLRLELAYTETVYHDKVSGQDRVADSGWQTYQPAKPAAHCGPIEMTSVVLLTEQNLVGERIPVLALSNQIGAIYESVLTLRELAGTLPHKEQNPRELIVDVTLRGERPNLANLYEVRATPPLPQAATAALERRLAEIPASGVRGGEVHFQVLFQLRAPRAGEPACTATKPQ